MKTAVVLHGVCDEEEYFKMDFPSPSNAHWFPWLQQNFLRAGLLCQALEMPRPYNPNYEEWKRTFEQLDIDSLSIVVGHSAGCGFILKWLHANPSIVLDKLIMVAPWLDPERSAKDFLEFELKDNALSNIKEVHILASNDDMESIKISVDEIMYKYPHINLHSFEEKGHFCLNDIGNTFEYLWDLCK